jgi:ATP-dependent DNA ligase
MLATTAAAAFDSEDWSYEIKWDGFRALARRDEQGCRLLGRHGTDFTDRFPQLMPALKKLARGTMLDGEIVAFRDGKPNFACLLKCTEKKVPAGVTLAGVRSALRRVPAGDVIAVRCPPYPAAGSGGLSC